MMRKLKDKNCCLLLLIGLMIPVLTQAQQVPISMVYKTIDTTKLTLNIYYPENYHKGQILPAIVLFFGGGWVNGSVKQMEPQAKHFVATEGIIAITADYRVQSRQKTTPFDAVRDAKSAIRYLRGHAKELGIDPNRLAAGGGSAGGHIAAAADLTSLDEPGEDRSISSRPNALVLFNPVFNNGPDNYGYERIGDRYPEISPFHNIKKGAAPTIAFFGTKDKFVPVATAQLYKKVMEENGNRCDLFFYNDQPHGFFNYKAGTDNKYFNITTQEADKFLKSLGYTQPL
ncbi:MAG: alpha/beta hydrolase [Bacteroidota bacterium]